MVVKNISSTSTSEFKSQLSTLLSSGYKPTLALVFSDGEFDNREVAQALNDFSIQYIACSSSGEILDGATYAKTISVSFFDMDKSYFHIVRQFVGKDQSYTKGNELANIALDKFDNPAFISLFTLNVNGEKVIAGLKDVLGAEPQIYGGMAADEVTFKPYVFTNENIDYDGFHSIVLDGDRIEFNSLAIAGWEAIGTEHTITKSEDNVIYEINEEPALDFFKKFFGFFSDPLSQNDEVTTVNSQYPLQIMRKDGAVLRAPLNSDEDSGTLIMAGPVHQGERFKFSIAPGFEVIDETIESFKKFKNQVDQPDAIILFSCKARHWAFGPMIDDEIAALNELWNVPYHGFFTFGEIGKNVNESTRFFNETCCLVTLKEK